MKNRKQLLADFYLDLLALPKQWQDENIRLMQLVRFTLANELESDVITIQNIFERMAAEDEKNY